MLFRSVKVESEKVGLKLNIQKTKIMASGPITLWQIDRETVETVADFIFLGAKITADGDCTSYLIEVLRHATSAVWNPFHSLAHSSPLAPKIPWAEEPGGQ